MPETNTPKDANSDAALSRHLSRLEEATLKAAEYMLKQIESPEHIKIWHKEDKTIVMTLDIECQRIVTEALGGELPVVGEEKQLGHELLRKAGDFYVIDPVDGTTSCKRFLHERNGQLGFGTLTGLVLGGKIHAAVFYHIPLRTIFSAVRGQGAWQLKWGERSLNG